MGECKECGYKIYKTLSNFKRSNPQICTHKNLLSKEELDLWYENNKKQCLFCGKDIPIESLGFSEYKKRKFCNNSCSASYINVFRGKNKKDNIDNNGFYIAKEKQYCLNCGKELILPKQSKYCSISCQKDYQYKDYIKKWKNGEISGSNKTGVSESIRRYIKEKYNNQCCKCGWHEINPKTNKVPVEIHHIDGNYQNNKEENLELLCPNCHSLTTTYKALNCGDGRKDRYK